MMLEIWIHLGYDPRKQGRLKRDDPESYYFARIALAKRFGYSQDSNPQ